MKQYNPWLKLVAVSLAGIIISFVILWGINQFSGYSNNMYSMNTYNYGMNMQGNVSMQGNMNIQNSSSGSMGMMDNNMMNMQGSSNSNNGGMMDDMMSMMGNMGM
jgi:hypothetical protein